MYKNPKTQSQMFFFKKLLREIIRPVKKILLARLIDKPMDDYYFKKYGPKVGKEDARR